MSISFKYIIHKVDKLINPKKYYTNNITKKIKTLTNGDKIYALMMPDLENLGPYSLMYAMDNVILTTCILRDIHFSRFENTSIISMNMIFPNINDFGILAGLSYHTTMDGQYMIHISIKGNDVYHSFEIEKYNGKLIFTTNKNTIKKYLINFSNIIKNIISKKVKCNELYKINDCALYKTTEYDYGNNYITNCKKQYAKLLNQLALL